jgi:preprotein translocase subunit YajC
MQVDGSTLAIVAVLLLVLLVFMVMKNKKDRKKFEEQMNRDYKKPDEAEHSNDPDDIKNA